MSIYLISTIIFIVTSIISSFFVFKKYKLTSGIFYLIFSVTMSMWFGLYFISFDSSYGEKIVLMMYRFQYSLSMIWLYSILFFVLFFWKAKQKTRNARLQIYACFLTFFLTSNFTWFIVENVEYSNKIDSYVEVFGDLYLLIVFLYFVLIPAFLITSFFKLRSLNDVNRERLKYIVSGYTVFLSVILSFLVFIPFITGDSSNLYFEQFAPVYTLPFIASVLYSSYRYKFFDLWFSIAKLVVLFISISLSIGIIITIKSYIFTVHNSMALFWWLSAQLNSTDFFFWIFLFLLIYRYLSSKLLSNVSINKFLGDLHSLKEKIPFLTTRKSLNNFLLRSFNTKFNIDFSNIDFYISNKKELCKFFISSLRNDVFINDMVFIEENKNKFHKQNILEEIDQNIGLYFPLYDNTWKIVWFLCVWRKKFWDLYSSEEIDALKDFAWFIQWHLKYISIYSQIHELNINLDKKVDEKTIEYNNLINRQKEFIAFVSHEIKNPITNAMFVGDALKSSIKKLSGEEKDLATEDISILNKELSRVASLTKTIFLAEKYDIHSIELYREFTDIRSFLLDLVESFKKKHDSIDIKLDLDHVGNIEIDQVQFWQVINNLLTNASKFLDQNNPQISVSLKKSQTHSIEITIEDNGVGFEGIDIEDIFDKYSTGESNSIGLWIGLYLCKRIVELHGGGIIPSVSNTLWWAKFSIVM